MLNELRYAFRNGNMEKAAALAALAAVDGVFFAWSAASGEQWVQILGIALSSIGFCALASFVLSADVRILKKLFSSPGAYYMAMAPRRPQVRILAQVAVLSAVDIACFWIGIAGIVLLSSGGMPQDASNLPVFYFASGFAMAAIFSFFGKTLERGVFYSCRLRALYGSACACAGLYASYTAASAALLPFAPFTRIGPILLVEARYGLNFRTALFFAVLFGCALAALACAAKAMERKVNI
jgi:hypothetical protein